MRFAALLVVCLLAGAARADTIIDTPPPGLAPGSVYQRVFVTTSSYPITGSTTYPPDVGVGGLRGADYNVTEEAFQNGLYPDWDGIEVPFHAILSDGTTNARDRLTIAGPIFNMANELIATDGADLWDGSIANPVRYDELGESVPDGTRVWTGSTGLGVKDPTGTCGSRLNPGLSGRFGSPVSSTGTWLNNGATVGNTSARLYALSPALVVPQPGDFNSNGTVDAADFAVWRKTDGTPANYDLWRTHFGESLPGSGAATTAIPKPPAFLLAAAAALVFVTRTSSRKI